MLIKELEKIKTQQILKESLGWNSIECAQQGFWLNKYTFIKADYVKVVRVDRQMLDGEVDTGPLPMLVLENVVEMMVDSAHKILAVEVSEKMGLWLDALGKILKTNT